MPYRDLDEFIIRLEQSDAIIYIKHPITNTLEIVEITRRIAQRPENSNTALVFEHVEDRPFPVITNLFGTSRRMAWALGVETLDALYTRSDNLVDFSGNFTMGAMMGRATEVMSALRAIAPTRTKTPPVQQVIITDKPDINRLPLLTHGLSDAHPTITHTQVITHHAETDARHIGSYPVTVLDGQTLCIHWGTHSRSNHHKQVAQQKGIERLPVIIALGGDPVAMWGAAVPLPPPLDAYLLAGWLRHKPLSFSKGVVQDVTVPADAEIIIEGWLNPSDSHIETTITHPYRGRSASIGTMMHITAITHRKRAYFPQIIPTIKQDSRVMTLAAEKLFLPLLRLLFNEIVDIHYPTGDYSTLAIVSIDSRFSGQAQKVMIGLWGMEWTMLLKTIVVVNRDVDVREIDAVIGRIIETVDWSQDVTRISGALDRSASTTEHGMKMGIDATIKPQRTPYPPPLPVNAEGVSFIAGNDTWVNRHGTLIVPLDLDQHNPRNTIQDLWQLCPSQNIIAVPQDTNLDDLTAVLKPILYTIDWQGDVLVSQESDNPARGHIGIDSTAKRLSAEWMPQDIVEHVTLNWKQYGLT